MPSSDSLNSQRWFGRACCVFAAALVLTLCLSSPSLHAQTFSAVYSFAGGTDGSFPNGSMIADSGGNLYGMTSEGGPANAGTIFMLSASGVETVLYSFTGGTDGTQPSSGLYRDPEGNLYGTTQNGGDPVCQCGVVFKLDTSHSLTVLHTFKGPEGKLPLSNVVVINGSIYGTTRFGGTGCGMGCGVLFKISELGSYTVLHRFAETEGPDPTDIIRDPAGNIYGITFGGDNQTTHKLFYGTIFKLDPSENFSTLFTFTSLATGEFPMGRLIRDVNGNFHGTTREGGTGCLKNDCGVVYRLSAAGVQSILHTFHQVAAGITPEGGVVDLDGALYGTTADGGDATCDCGVLFSIGNTGQYTVLHRFTGLDGHSPLGELTLTSDHTIYGTTFSGGTGTGCNNSLGCGVIYKLTPASETASQ
jgi:uncharacterized repeat protein (TIGR03803 family)